MNVTVSKKEFLSVIGRAAGIAEKKGTMPSLSMVKLDMTPSAETGGGLVVSATDLYQSLVDVCMVDSGAKAGAIAVNASDLVARIKSMPDGPINLSTKDDTLIIKAGGTARKFQQRGLAAEDYPPIPGFDKEAARLTIDAPVLASLIAHTAFSVSGDMTRAHLNSLLVEWNGDVLRAVSTDGHRLSKAERQVSRSASVEMLIPLKAVRAIHELATNMIGDAEKPASIEIVSSGPNAFFLAGKAVFSVKLVDAQFPPWKQVIPASTEKTVRAPRAFLIDALRAVGVAASDRTGGVKLRFSKGKLLLESESPDSGNGDDEVPIEYGGSNLSIGFNGQYLIEALSVLSSDEVELGLNGELDPMVIKPAQQATGTDFVGVAMPMRI